MAKQTGQKFKLIRLLEILKNETDENHKLNTTVLIEKLRAYDIEAERKSIYSDIEALNDLGYEVLLDKSKLNGGYYLAERHIEKYELAMLVDAVSSSKFITEKKSRELIKKLEGLLSKYDAKELEREVYVTNRIKSANESIYITVDELHRAICEKKRITFQYCEWNLNKELVPRKDGKLYDVSPLALLWDDENYYLVGLDNTLDEIRHYRVDKLKKVVISKDTIKELEETKHFDIALYSNKIFGMYGGEEETVTLSFPVSLIGVCIDRFGKDISIRTEHNGEYFSFRANVVPSKQFYGWITGLGSEVKILGPQSVVSDYKNYLSKTLSNY